MIVAYLQWCLVISAFVLLIRAKYQPGFLKNIWLILPVVFVVLALPVGGINIYGYFWGVFGQLSITTTFLVARYVVNHFGDPGRPVLQFQRPFLYGPVAFLTLVFYPLALGVSPIDPYGWGYQPFYLAIVLLVVALLFWGSKQRLLAWLMVAVVACHQLRLLESENLWDYLLDPFLVFYSWGWGVRRLKEYFKIRARS